MCERKINSKKERLEAAEELRKQYAGAVLLKGGHDGNQADDLLVENEKEVWFSQKHIDNSNTHGTGCTLSAAIACGLAEGLDMEKSVKRAKEYITGAIEAGLDLGMGNGPLNHMYGIVK